MTDFIVNFFFYAKYLPEWLVTPGQYFPFDVACMCSLPNLFGVILHILIIALLIKMLLKAKEMRGDNFFSFLLTGIFFSAISKTLDWYMNMRSGVGAFKGVWFSYSVDITLGMFQLIGTIIILYAIITKLFYIHHEAESSA